MEFERALVALRQRGDELQAAGPGHVRVARVHHIDDVRSLRACREVISQREAFDVRQAIAELESQLVGVEVAKPPDKPMREQDDTLIGRLARPFLWATAQLTKRARDYENWHQLTTTAGGPAALPPPRQLLEAAETWFIAQLAEGRVSVDRTSLLRPWEEADVVRID